MSNAETAAQVAAPNRAAERIEALSALHPKGYDLSLDRISRLLAALGDPQNRLPPVIHVAGTNGKGSTIAFARAILEAAGLSVHVHTSPHLVRWHERYRIGQAGGGRFVEDEVLVEAIDRVAAASGGEAITVFEIMTAVGFVLFSEHPADACLIEVGLGGRFDSTNVMEKTAVSVITQIALDHMAHLGNTRAAIAFEKAGIIRRSTPVVTAPQTEEALEVIERQAARHRSPLHAADDHYRAWLEEGCLLYQDETGLLDLHPPKLPGRHQIDNAGAAIAAARSLAQQLGIEIGQETVDRGLQQAYWPGRMQRLARGSLVETMPDGTELWVDGGHNEDAAAAIASYFAELNERHSRPLLLVCGMLNTKDPEAWFRQMVGLAQHVFTVPLPSSDADFGPGELAAICCASGLEATPCTSLAEALRTAVEHEPDSRILIGGSLYLAGDALEANGTPPV